MCSLFHERLPSYQGNMANFEIEEEPMLLETYAHRSDEFEDSNFRRPVSKTQSASMSIPMVSMESYDREASLVGHTGPFRSMRKTLFPQMSGPLRSVRKTLFPQMSGPLYATHGTGNLLQQSGVVTGNNVVENRTEKFATFHSTGENNWNSNYDWKNEHFLRSGQLGMCNDPYCTTCPTHFSTAQQGNPRNPNILDHKVSFFLK